MLLNFKSCYVTEYWKAMKEGEYLSMHDQFKEAQQEYNRADKIRQKCIEKFQHDPATDDCEAVLRKEAEVEAECERMDIAREAAEDRMCDEAYCNGIECEMCGELEADSIRYMSKGSPFKGLTLEQIRELNEERLISRPCPYINGTCRDEEDDGVCDYCYIKEAAERQMKLNRVEKPLVHRIMFERNNEWPIMIVTSEENLICFEAFLDTTCYSGCTGVCEYQFKQGLILTIDCDTRMGREEIKTWWNDKING